METMSPTRKIWVRETGAVEKRDLWSSLKRGFRGRCPRCGKGKLFRGFLKVDNRCSMCGLDFTPHRADDLPAYLVIVIVGHIVVPTALLIETDYSPPVGLQLAIYLPLTVAFSLALLQPVKGAVVGLQWALRCTALITMHLRAFRRLRFSNAWCEPRSIDFMPSLNRHDMSRRGFCLCCVGATTLAATDCWLMPRQALAKARNIVDLIRDDAAKAQDS
jgi:uncharacterized protein (DUF983 family)